MPDKEFYKNKVAWITGASSGIGEALVKKLADYHVRLIISSNKADELERVKNECNTSPDNIVIIPVELSNPDQVEKTASEIPDIFGRLDFIFNVGGVSQRSLATETSIETDRKIMEINFFSAVIITKKLLPFLLKQGGGHIIAISSLAGKFGVPYRTAYSASKHAIQGYFETIRTEFHKKGIRVTVVFPGRVRTNISLDAIGPEGKPHGKMDKELAKGISPEKCASDILKGIEKNKEEVFSGGFELISFHIKRLFPGLFFRIYLKTNSI